MKQNGFWIALGVVLALIVLGFVYFVLGAQSQRDKESKTLAGLNGDLTAILEKPSNIPSSVQIATYNDRKNALMKELEECKGWYKTYDEALETWFQGLPNPPAAGAFKAIYDTLCAKMQKDLEAASIHHGRRPDEGAIAPIFGPAAGGPGAPVGIQWAQVGGTLDLPDIQKRFWICQRITEALLAIQQTAPGAVSSLEEIRFAPGPKGTPGEEYPGWSSNPCELPGRYGTVITCGIRVEIQNAELPKLLKLLLDTDGPGPKLLTHLRGVRVVPSKTLPDKIEEPLRVEEGQNAAQAKEKRLAELKAEWLKPRPIRAFITYEVFDFDSDKLSKPFEPVVAGS